MAPANNASGSESPEPSDSPHILDRIERYAQACPQATHFTIRSETEAAELLLAIAATIKQIVKDIHDPKDRRTVQGYAHLYRKAVVDERALEYLRQLNDSDQLEIHGLKIEPTRIALQ